jgi:N-methylhydantoinase A/oxoprolinase/acetone carboxylase beta subunit
MPRYLVACDAGGTMTDVIIVDEEGRFVIGKAPTTPHDESIGYVESLDEALGYWADRLSSNGGPSSVVPNAETAIYTGTAMLNTLINLNGLRTGLIVTRGFEDIIVQGRGSQTFIGFEWPEISHMQYRKHREPLVPRKYTRGVTERIDMFGAPVIPLYEHEVELGVRELLSEGCESLAVLFLNSFINPAHERRVAEIAAKVMAETGRTIPIILSCDVAPIVREVSRANATVIQAYAAEPSRKQLMNVEEKLVERGYKHSLKTVLGYGGVTNIRYPRLFETVMSGPVGGIMGGHYLAKTVGGLESLVCADMGGTSFDAGCITAGILPIEREPPFQQMYVNVPMLDIRSIGAGTGTYIRLDPDTNRLKLGPDSAGGTPGPVFQNAGNEIPTIGDCDLLLGIINEENYLGGRVKVHKDKAEAVFREKIAAPLGLDVQAAAETCVELINVLMREHLIRSLMLGYDLRDYVLLGYGGAGPMHLAGYAGDYPWKGVATVPYAAAFSAWGGACMDYAHRRHKSVSAMIPPVEDPTMKLMAAQTVSAAWEELGKQLLEELAAEGFARDKVTLKHSAFVKYFGHLDDLEVASPMTRLTNEADVDRLMAAFEDVFTKTYTLAGKPPVPTFQIGEVGVVAEVSTVKPAVSKFELEGKEPPKVALKGKRPVYQQRKWADAPIYEMDELRAGNEVNGVAIIEAPNTTLFVPPGWNAKLDEHMIFWMNRGGN